MKKKLMGLIAGLGLAVMVMSGCSNDSDVASDNLSIDADNFKIERRVVFFNGITDKYLLEIQGLCSITEDGKQLEVTCKVGKEKYKKHFLGLSDNVSYFVEQVEGTKTDPYHYKVTFKPEEIIPDIDLRTSKGAEEGTNDEG